MWYSKFKQFFFIKTLYNWAIYIFNAYYLTFIFQETNDSVDVILNIVSTYISLFVGLVIASAGMGKLGAEKTLRLSFLLFVLSGLAGIFLTDASINSFVFVSFLRGFASGFFWAAMNFMEMTGMGTEDRSKYFSLSFGSSTIFSVVAPIFLGAILTFYASYIPIYLLFSILCIIGATYPYDFKIDTDMQLTKDQFSRLFMAKHFDGFFYTKTLAAIMWMSSWIVAALVPFIVLGSELNMGLFIGVSSLLASAISLITRNSRSKLKTKWGTFLLVLTTIASIPLIVEISFITLTLFWMVSSITSAILMPVESEFGIKVDNHLSKSKNAFSELVVTQEIVYLFARVGLGLMVLFLLHYFPIIVVLQSVFAISVVVKVAHYIVAATFIHEKMI